ncbi:LysM peptidoglycan-binding domain-containing protein [Luteolibacter algae]|uniref:LysM peptidoglycan-binding domain-containing protein n=1 Tax=Luteolibacter algae TaxID=454151 RepID=A0ABW5D5C1_9BACT
MHNLQLCFAYLKHSFMLWEMFCAVRKLAPLLLIPLFTQCGSKSAPSASAVTGPFDSRGNYIEDWVDQPEKWYKPPTPGSNQKSKPTAIAKKETTPPPVVLATREVERPPATVSAPKPTPKPTPKPKPKPVVVRHTVRKGDTLSGLARRYGTSISKIKSANRISGTVIRLGQTLTIPK